MANIVISVAGETWMQLHIDNLANPANTYIKFRIRSYRTAIDASNDTNYLQNYEFTSTFTSNRTQSVILSNGMSCGNTYYFKAWRALTSTYFTHLAGPVNGSTLACPTYTRVTTPQNFNAVGGSRKVDLTWSSNTATYAGDFVLEYKRSEETSYRSLTTLSKYSSSYTHNYLLIGATYNYRIKQKHTISSDYDSLYSSRTASTLPEYEQLSPPTNFRGTSSTTTSISYSWTASAFYFGGDYRIRYRRYGTTTWSYSSIISESLTSYTIYSLLSGYTYEAGIMVYHTGDTSYSSNYSSSVLYSTKGQLATPYLDPDDVYATTPTSIYAILSSSPIGTDYYQWRIFTSAGSLITSTGTSNNYRTFTGLTTGATYGIDVKVLGTGYTDSEYSNRVSVVCSVVVRPANWYWSTTVLNAINNKTAFSNLTVTEWNNFLTRVNDFCTYKQVSLLSSAIFRTSQNNILYASDMRTIGNKIYSMGGGVAAAIRDSNIVYSGANVYGWYFTNLSAALNQIT